jgi:hypothetical protein
MNRDAKKRWLDALRSGKYKQGRLFLRTNESEFCCLGVLCDVLSKSGWAIDETRNHFTYVGPNGCLGTACLPEDVAYNTQISRAQETVLASKNDEGLPFQEIADYIEVNL